MEAEFRAFIADHDIDFDATEDVIFFVLCSLGNIRFAAWYYNSRHLDVHALYGYCHLTACIANDLPMMKWLYSISGPHHHFTQCLREAADSGYVDILRWMFTLGDGIPDSTKTNLASRAAKKGHLNVIAWLLSLNGEDVNYHRAFSSACRSGNLAIARYIYNEIHVDPHFKVDYPFRAAYIHHKEDVARWLLSLGNVDVDSLVQLDGLDRGEIAEWVGSS